MGHGPADEAAARKIAATGLIETHDAVFRRTARRYSICADDSEDAYQRALEILLTKAPPIEGDSLVRWMQTVTKREALAVRRQRERLLSGPRPHDDEERDPLDAIASPSPEPNDRAVSRERVARSNEALRALKPQEVRALTLKAEGYSYAEIGEITGWTYTKINRCMAEGRKRFLQVFEELEQGQRCKEVAAALSAVADGEAGEHEADAVEIHLRSCGACRARLRAFRGIPQKVLELLPTLPAMEVSTRGGAREWVAERGGAFVDKAREASYSLLARGGAEDTARIASGGGTRGAGMAALAKVLAVCGATAAGSATCVATGLVDPGDVGIGSSNTSPALERADRPTEARIDQQALTPASNSSETATEADAAATPPVTRVQQTERELGFESAGPTAPSGGEFGAPAGGRGSAGSGSGGGGGGFGIE
jgi:RNA polymerase sigma factor (sigma-70 family)